MPDVPGADGVAVELHLDPRDREIAIGFEAAGPQSARAARRVHAIDGVEIAPSAGPLVKVVSVAGLDDVASLDAAGDVAVELDAGQIAIVIGPASALCDRLRGDLYEARKSALEMGSSEYGCALVASFKLPRGLWRQAHRQSLGMWVLRGATAVGAAVVADLSGESVDASELAADLLGALEQTGARSYRYGRALRYAAIWTGDTVVPPGIGAQHLGSFDAGTAYDRVVSATIVTREAIPGFDLPAVRGGTLSPSSSRSLGDLVEEALSAVRVALVSRMRISIRPAVVRVITAEGGAPSWIDRLVEADRYRSAVHTEPGDVVFSMKPPRAVVDETGGAIVASPSRILRPDPARAGTGPRALAAAINRLQDSSEWKTWLIPRFPADQIQRVEEALNAVDEHLAEIRKHEAGGRRPHHQFDPGRRRRVRDPRCARYREEGRLTCHRARRPDPRRRRR